MSVMYSMACYLTLYVLFMTAVTTFGCSCVGPKTLQEHYCDAGFVIRTKILRQKAIFDAKSSMPQIPVSIRYTVKTLKVFKLNETVDSKINIHEVHTGSSSCGLRLNIGKIYAIAGRLRNGQMWVEACEYATQWSDLSPHQIKYLRWKYKKHCDCSVKMTEKRFAKFCTTPYNKWLCYAKHSYCEQASLRQRKVCRWQMNKPLRDCLFKLEP